MQKIYMYCGGGFGDCLNTFFIGPPVYAQAIKDKYPDTSIQVVCNTSNESIATIFDLHPAFDKVILSSTLGDATKKTIEKIESDGYKYWSTVFDQNTFQRTRQKIYLSQDEEDTVQKIRDLGPYIAVHPFNSAGTGITATHFAVNTDYPLIINQIIDAGYNVVQVGGNWVHIPTGNVQKEDFQFDHPKFINVVNRFNARMIARVVMEADKFIGTSSVWVIAATVNGVPSFMILPHHMQDILHDEKITGEGLRGTLITKYGLFAGAAIPGLYDATKAFITTPLPKKTPCFTSEGLVLT